MENKFTLKELRLQKSLTQTDLAKASGISIRTIQRIEKGMSTASPYTIKKLANFLQVDINELQLPSNNTQANPNDEYNKIRLMNYSILSVLMLPFGNIILPVIIFLVNKNDEQINTIGRKIISFQIILTPVLFFVTMLIFIVVGRGNGAIPLPVFICYSMYSLVCITIVIITAISIDRDNNAPFFFPKIL